MFKSVSLFVGLIFLAGCAGNSVHRLPPTESAGTNAARAYPKPPTPAPPTEVRTPPPAPAVRIVTWDSLDDWATRHNLAAPRRLTDVPVAAYSIASKYGTMVLEIGSREASWNGVEVYLGFAPQLIDGEVCLYGLDLEKNLEPLLCEPPIAFRPGEVIVIDPGHGGSNSGTHSVLDGRLEKEFTLDWALRLKLLLEAEGWKVYLTRESDTDISLSNRVAFAQAHHADLFISLHFNSAGPDKTQAGIETYCVPPTGMLSSISRGNYADPQNEVLPNNAYDADNLRFAVQIHSGMVHAVRMPDRGVRRARFISVLRGQRRPAILIEGGYLSNPREAKLIESPAYRQKLAKALGAALAPRAEREDGGLKMEDGAEFTREDGGLRMEDGINLKISGN